MLLNWKELLSRIISIPSMINFGCNLSGYLYIQDESIRQTQHLTVQCSASPSQSQQNYPEMLICS